MTKAVRGVDPELRRTCPESDGRVCSALVVEGGILRSRVEKLTVGSRDRTKLVDGVIGQVELVRSLIDEDCPVRGVLCFIDADWPLIGGAFITRGIEVLWPKKLEARLVAPMCLVPGLMEALIPRKDESHGSTEEVR